MSDRYSFRKTTIDQSPYGTQQKRPKPKKPGKWPKWLARATKHQNALAQENSTNSPLLSLPAEIRVMIWTYALGGMSIKVKHANYLYRTVYGKNRCVGRNCIDIGLPRTCRQIHSELGVLLYTHNTFVFGYTHKTLGKYPLSSFRHALKPAQQKGVRHIVVAIPLVQNDPWRTGRHGRDVKLVTGPSFSELFPGLETITIDTTTPWTSKESQVQLLKLVREREPGKRVLGFYVTKGKRVDFM